MITVICRNGADDEGKCVCFYQCKPHIKCGEIFHQATVKRIVGKNARCIACHGQGTPLRLQPLAQGSTTWNDEDSRQNFLAVRRVVMPGNLQSKLLLHPLEEKAGGDFYHNGGKHFSSQNDPEWQTLKAWVLGQTAQ